MSLETTTIQESYKAVKAVLDGMQSKADGRGLAQAKTMLENAMLLAATASTDLYGASDAEMALVQDYARINQVFMNLPLGTDPGSAELMMQAKLDLSRSLIWAKHALMLGPSPAPARLPHEAPKPASA